MMNIQKPAVAEHSEDRVQDNPFVGKTIVVTGKVEPYTRDGINDLIESLGAHAGSSVSKKTDYLVCGENAGSYPRPGIWALQCCRLRSFSVWLVLSKII